jgi:hypothetical protein
LYENKYRYKNIDMTTDHRFQIIFKERSLSAFWCEVGKDCPFG